MMKWVFDLTTGALICGGPYDPIYDPSTQGLITVPDNPDPRTQRVDQATLQLRTATDEEQTTYAATRLTEQMRGQLDKNHDLLAVAMWIAQRLGVPVAQARQEILAIRRTL